MKRVILSKQERVTASFEADTSLLNTQKLGTNNCIFEDKFPELVTVNGTAYLHDVAFVYLWVCEQCFKSPSSPDKSFF